MTHKRHFVISEYWLDFPREIETALCGEIIENPVPVLGHSEFLAGHSLHFGLIVNLCRHCEREHERLMKEPQDNETRYLYVLMSDKDVKELEAEREMAVSA